MKYTVPVLSVAAVAAAQPAFTNSGFNVEEGQPFELTFTGCEGGCSIILKNGSGDNLQDVKTLTGSATGGSYTVTLDQIPSDTYAFEIVNNETGEENYSKQFEYEGQAAAPSTTEEMTTTSAEETTSTSAPPTTTSEATSTTEESTTTPSSTSESSSMTTPSSSTSEESTPTASDETSSTGGAEPTESAGIPDPDDAAGSLGVPMTLVMAAAAGLFFFN